MTAKEDQLENGEITSRTFYDYKRTTDRLVSVFGLTRLVEDLATDDFRSLRNDMAKTWGPVRSANEVQRVKTVFKFGIDNALVETAIRDGTAFNKPSRKMLRRYKASNSERMFAADHPIAKETRKLLDRLGIHRRGLGFYALRHTFRTVADETRDFPAMDLIMGHARDNMASVYRERISNERLMAVTDHVRAWLFEDDDNQ